MSARDIVGKLTDAQKRALLGAKPTPDGTKYWLGRTRIDTHGILHGLGLVDYHSAPARLTPLGHAVRYLLDEQVSA